MSRNQRHGVSKTKRNTEREGHKDDTAGNARQKHSMRNRCCYASPDRKSFGQLTESSRSNKTPNTVIPVRSTSASARTIDTQELRKCVLQGCHKVDNSCQLSKKNVEYYDGTEWQIIDDIDKYIQEKYGRYVPACPNIARAVHIAEMPRVKIIAEKYSRYKQNNVEIRKLDEKVVCVEYDVFDRDSLHLKPFQVMRAFFSIKPVHGMVQGKTLTGLPSSLSHKFDITFADLQKLSEKEVEIIDGKIAENQPYLDDLRKILRYKHVISKSSTSLDLHTLYELANTDFNYGRNTDLISKVELQDIKDLILKTCRSSVYGINRRTVRPSDNTEYMSNTISQSIIAELLRRESVVSQ